MNSVDWNLSSFLKKSTDTGDFYPAGYGLISIILLVSIIDASFLSSTLGISILIKEARSLKHRANYGLLFDFPSVIISFERFDLKCRSNLAVDFRICIFLGSRMFGSCQSSTLSRTI